MSDYCVPPIKGHWKNWERLATKAGVSFTGDQLTLGREIFGNRVNMWPSAKTSVVRVLECFGPTNPSEENGTGLMYQNRQPVHPVKLLTLLAGIGDEEKTEHREWTYRTIASTLHLYHPDGRMFTFFVNGGEEKEINWKGEFLPSRQCIGRSMYIWGYPGNEGMNRSSFFVPDAEGMYGPCVTCFP